MPEAARAEDAPETSKLNPFNDPFTQEVIEEHERLDAECESIMMTAVGKCNPLRKEQQELLDSAKDRGMNKRALKAHLNERKLRRKYEAIREGLEEPDQDALDLLKHHLGQLDMFEGDLATRAAAGTA